MDDKRQKYIAELLVKATIQDKVILTTREILNFIYDILVAQNFSFTKYQRLLVDDTAFLKEYLRHVTPALIFDSSDVTTLMNLVQKYDPLLVRTEADDAMSISYYVSSNVSKNIETAISNLPYAKVLCGDNLLVKVNSDKVLKSMMFNLIVRSQFIESDEKTDVVYEQYLKDLYWFNAGKGKKLGSLYNMVEKGVAQWCGSDEDGNLCLEEKRAEFSIYENVKFKEMISHIPASENTDELQRFIPSVIVGFEDCGGGQIFLDIDYSLYELIYRLNLGYIQTAEDRNNHADFISFINRILQTGSLTESLYIVSSDGKKANISKGLFGYKFKVVK
jgi:DNA phosphorothioation-dependent restriction protein DptF